MATSVIQCSACSGSGIFFKWIAGTKQNAGPCFRCVGKGEQDADDAARNAAYDEWSAYRAIMADMATSDASPEAQEDQMYTVALELDLAEAQADLEFEAVSSYMHDLFADIREVTRLAGLSAMFGPTLKALHAVENAVAEFEEDQFEATREERWETWAYGK